MTKDKIEKLAKETQKEQSFRSDDIRYVLELATAHPRWSVNRIFREVLKPRIRTRLIVYLTPKLKRQLEKAVREYKIKAYDLVCDILEEWLDAKQL